MKLIFRALEVVPAELPPSVLNAAKKDTSLANAPRVAETAASIAKKRVTSPVTAPPSGK